MTDRCGSCEVSALAFAGEASVGVLRARYTKQTFPPHRHEHMVIGVDASGAHSNALPRRSPRRATHGAGGRSA